MGFDTISVDQLVARSGLTAAAVSSMLLILELDGRVVSQAGAFMPAPNREAEMKESVLDVLMYLFENYYMDEEIEGRPTANPCR